jgi:hypothetical protein
VAVSVYEPVWCQRELPRAAMDARRNTLTGILTIDDGSVKFSTEDQTIEFRPILSVQKGRRGSDFINRWIEIQYGDSEHPSTVYLNDGAWRGWRPILASTHRRIVADLSAVVSP